MEEIYKEDICYHYGVLTGHCIGGENYEKAAEYARLEEMIPEHQKKVKVFFDLFLRQHSPIPV